MKKEWKNNVYLARSRIQGLGLYAKRDIEMNAMIIEYKGEVIRSEVSWISAIVLTNAGPGKYFVGGPKSLHHAESLGSTE